MYPDNFDGYNLKQLREWRTKILAAKQKAEEQTLAAKLALDKVQRAIKQRENNL
jgi:hypothetical protein